MLNTVFERRFLVYQCGGQFGRVYPATAHLEEVGDFLAERLGLELVNETL